MPTVKFINEKKEIDVPVGTNLRQAAFQAGVYTNNGINGYFPTINKYVNCHGLGLCGTCTVNIVEGTDQASEKGMIEKMKFKGLPLPDHACMHYIGNEETMRLSCQTKVEGDMEVDTSPAFNLYGENFFS